MMFKNLFRAISLIAIVGVCSAGPAEGRDRLPSKRLVAERGDREYAEDLHRRLLGRDPTGSELQVALQGLAEREHRIRLQNTVLDSAEFGARVDDGTFLHGLFRQLRGRPPLIHEMTIGLHFLDEGVPRSEIFGSVLHAALPSGDDRSRMDRLYRDLVLDFRPRKLTRYARSARAVQNMSRERQRQALETEATQLGGALPGPPEPLETSASGNEEYQVFFGYLHAHTSVSYDALLQGSGGPFEAFEQARFEAGLDFMGLSDHAEFISLWPWNNEWDLLRAAADEYDEDDVFVALRGFEYSNPIYGHVNVFGTDSFTSAWVQLTLAQFYTWVWLNPQSVATFNHPAVSDILGTDLYHFRYYPRAAPSMVGVEILTHRNESGPPDGYERYSVGYVATDGLGHLDEAIHAGWRVAGVSAQDNHRGTWGLADDYRTGVLATRLTRAAIRAAIRARRFYTTQDKNLLMSFRADGFEMGASIPGGDKVFTVELDDEDGEGFFEILFYANGRLAEVREVSGTGAWHFPVPASSEPAYYYVMVMQDDGDRAMSAPIWVQGQP